MKKDAVIVNTSRGPIIDESALTERRIAGAALDVFEPEPLAPDHPLRWLDNVINTPHIIAQDQPTTIVNVTSGGAYVPQVFAPVYSACKAALHSYTITLRHALATTKCRVVELAPPAVQTALATLAHGAPLDAFCDAVFTELVESDAEIIGYATTAGIDRRSCEELDTLFAQSAARAAVRQY